MNKTGDKIHVRLISGRFQNWRRLISWPFLLAFFGLVWVQVGGEPWLLFDFGERRLVLFGNWFSWHDLHIMTGLMIAGSFLLFSLAMAWGRVWCGFACPQSVWTWLFIRIEQLTEGRASQRARNERLPLRGLRLVRRLLKHSLWLLLALATAITFTGYFVPIREVVAQLVQLNASWALLLWLLTMTLLTYLNAGLVREQICLHACPYSRFQSVMMDDFTRKVSYDRTRGEPRRGTGAGTGACVDCTLCVQVCPTGIDIRNGMQPGCIDCGACIDACDPVMIKTGQPTGLIRFASEQQLAGRPDRFWRPRLLGYALILLTATLVSGYGVLTKKELVAEIRRDRGELFQILADGQVCNFYRIKVEGFNPQLTQVELTLLDQPRMQLHGPQSLPLDNTGDWVAYRICQSGPQSGTQPLQIRFAAGPVTLTKRTSFMTQVAGRADLRS